MGSLFPGPAVDLSAPDALWRGEFRAVDEIPPPVRHAAGYELFAQQVDSDDEHPAALAADVRLLAAYLRRHDEQIRAGGDALLDSAAVFLGNALIARVEDARWRAIGPGRPEVCQGGLGGGVLVFAMTRLLVEADDHHLPELDDFLLRWDGHAAAERARSVALEPAAARLVLRGVPAVVPPFACERDLPLVALLDHLVEHLTTHYEATATWTAPLPHDPRTMSATARTVRFTPHDPDAAPVVVSVDTVGAVAVRAGALHDFFFFRDDGAELEATLLAVAAGLYREVCLPEPDGMTGFRLGRTDGPGETSGLRPTAQLEADRVAAATALLDALPDGWAPWTLRSARRR